MKLTKKMNGCFYNINENFVNITNQIIFEERKLEDFEDINVGFIETKDVIFGNNNTLLYKELRCDKLNFNRNLFTIKYKNKIQELKEKNVKINKNLKDAIKNDIKKEMVNTASINTKLYYFYIFGESVLFTNCHKSILEKFFSITNEYLVYNNYLNEENYLENFDEGLFCDEEKKIVCIKDVVENYNLSFVNLQILKLKNAHLKLHYKKDNNSINDKLYLYAFEFDKDYYNSIKENYIDFQDEYFENFVKVYNLCRGGSQNE